MVGGKKRRYGDLFARIGRKGSPITLVSPVVCSAHRNHTFLLRVFIQPLFVRRLTWTKVPDLRLMRVIGN